MNERVIDSSIVFAVLRSEHSDYELADIVDGAIMSAVNVAEGYSKLREFGIQDAPALRALLGTLSRIEPFTEAHALITGELREATRHLGMSLGDRACLALAINLGAEVFTADRIWSKATVSCRIHVVR